MTPRALLTSVACVLSLACSGRATVEVPTGQVLLYVMTDAPLPPAPGVVPGPDAPPALFDRLRVDFLAPPNAPPCLDCSRDFELDGREISNGSASIQFVAQPGVSGYVARARLFRFIALEAGEPPPISTIDVYAALPVVERDTVAPVTMMLKVDDVGRTLGSMAAPTQPLAGKPNAASAEIWPKAKRVPCTAKAKPGEVCVPGGAFWIGNPYSGLHHEGADASVSRLVALSPYFVDLHEVTVAEYRASGLATLANGSSTDPLVGHAKDTPATAALAPLDVQYFCTYSDAPLTAEPSRENLPINCVSWTAASAFCAGQGKRLPSEAEYEYLAGALKSDLFVWGSTTPTCGNDTCCAVSVWGRGGFMPGSVGSNMLCRSEDDLGGPLPSGSAALDRLSLGGQEVVDLMGNVSEWTRDDWNRITEPCWAGRPLLVNPECGTPSTLDKGEMSELHTLKGEDWSSLIYPAAHRGGGELATATRGFRCVRQDK